MKIIEISFLLLTIIIPLFFVYIALTSVKKIKKHKKFRKRIILAILISLLLNGSIYIYIHNRNEHKENPNYKEENNSNTPSDTDSIDDTPKTSKGYKIEVIDDVTYIDGYLIVNKTYPLKEDFIPKNTYKEAPKTGICETCIDKEAYSKFQEMKSDASKQNLNIWIQSGYRSYSYQGALYDGYVKRSGKEAADTYSARSGHSEHQSGLAIDLNTVTDSFANTKEGIWINNNCYKYGFIIRYPKNKDNETGYKYEPWHLRYVGDLAEKLYNDGDWITMEDYFGITSEYAN